MTSNINIGNICRPLFNCKGETIAVNGSYNATGNLFFSVTINYVRGALLNSKNILRNFIMRMQNSRTLEEEVLHPNWIINQLTGQLLIIFRMTRKNI